MAKSIRQLAFRLHAQVIDGTLTEDEAAKQLALAREGGLTLKAAKELVRNPHLYDRGGRYHEEQ